MALNNKNVHIGMARIFLGATAPSTGLPPTLMTIDSDGVPTSGTEVGYTNGPATFMYKANKQEVQAEQSLNPIDVFVVSEEASLEFTAMEHVFNTLKTAFDNVGYVSDSSKDLFYGGDSSGLSNVNTQCVVLTSRNRLFTTKFEVLTLYKVYNVEGVTIGYNRTGVAEYKVTLKALVDVNRLAGDRLFQFYRERPSSGVSPSASVSPSSSKSPSASTSPS